MDASIGTVTTATAPAAPLRRPAEPAQRIEPPKSAPQTADQRKAGAEDDVSRLKSRLLAERTIERDDDTGSLVYRLIDVSTGFVTFQTPSDARLKMRAYIDGVLGKGAEPPVVQVTA